MTHTRRSPGEGSITQRNDGRWQASIQLDGKRRSVYGRTRTEAADKLEALKRQAHAAGQLPASGKTTVNALLDAWLEVKAPTLKPRTLADYHTIADALLRPAVGRVTLSRLTPARIARLYAGWQAEGKHRTALKAHRVLSAALALAVRWGWLGANPCEQVDAPSYRPERKALWTPAQLALFLEGTRNDWLHPLWLVLLGSGCRLGEALALQWPDVDMRTGLLTVSKSTQMIAGQMVTTTPKTRAGVRQVLLPSDVLAALRAHRGRQAAQRLTLGHQWAAGEHVFSTLRGTPLTPNTPQWALPRWCAKLQLPRVTCHGLRHLSASLLLAGGVAVPDVSRRLGHATPSITLAVYSHSIPGRDDGAARVLDNALGKAVGLSHRER